MLSKTVFQKSLTNPKNLTGYKNLSGLLTITLLLFASIISGLVSFFYSSPMLFQLGAALMVALMVIDLLLVHPNTLKRKWYLAHHFVTIFWACIAFFQADYLAPIGAGLLAYMLLGAFARRVKTLWSIYQPKAKKMARHLHSAMIFCDFCDPLVIIIFLSWIYDLSTIHQIIFFSLVLIRLKINISAYPRELKTLKQLVNKKQVWIRSRFVYSTRNP